MMHTFYHLFQFKGENNIQEKQGKEETEQKRRHSFSHAAADGRGKLLQENTQLWKRDLGKVQRRVASICVFKSHRQRNKETRTVNLVDRTLNSAVKRL